MLRHGALLSSLVCLQVQHKHLTKANQLTAQTYHHLSEVYEALGNVQQAISHSEAVLESLQKSYPDNSTAVAFQQLKLGRLLRTAGNTSAAQSHADAAQKCLKLHFGSHDWQ